MNDDARGMSGAVRPDPVLSAVWAAMIAGACTFLNVYCTQPLLPLFQQLFHASEMEVSFTIGAVTLSVALMAPIVGMVAESVGRKKVIVPALFAMGVCTLLTATANDLQTLVLWRFLQGLFVPGVIAVIIAYINEEFPNRVGAVMSAYVAGTVFGGFLGRFLTGTIAVRWDWRTAFVLLGVLDLIGAVAVSRWLPMAVRFRPGTHLFRSFLDTLSHLRNYRLLAVCGIGFTILFSLVGVFTYISFHLAKPPYGLTPGALGSVFFVYLLGCIVTPLSGPLLDRHGFRWTAFVSVGMSIVGLCLTLIPSLPVIVAGLAIFSSGIFISQSAATVLTGRVAERARSAAAGLYVTAYYTGGSTATVLTAWFWTRGGWPACVGLFVVASILTLVFGTIGARSIGKGEAECPVVDTAI